MWESNFKVKAHLPYAQDQKLLTPNETINVQRALRSRGRRIVVTGTKNKINPHKKDPLWMFN